MKTYQSLANQGTLSLSSYNNNTNYQPRQKVDDVYGVLTTAIAIPLERLCSLDVRELLEQGTPKGSGHNQSAIKVLKNFIGVENYCRAYGFPYQGTDKELYESFLLVSGFDSDSTTESPWQRAIALSSPSLSRGSGKLASSPFSFYPSG